MLLSKTWALPCKEWATKYPCESQIYNITHDFVWISMRKTRTVSPEIDLYSFLFEGTAWQVMHLCCNLDVFPGRKVDTMQQCEKQYQDCA